MVATLDFTNNAMAKIISGHTMMSGIPENHNGRYQSHESAYILARIISFYYLTLFRTGAILDFYVLRQHF